MGIQTGDKILKEEENIISELEAYLKLGNKKGNERRIISIGQSLVKYDLSIEKSYIEIICKSDYPISAAMALNSMHHEGVEILKEIILENMETLQWSLDDKIISLLYIKNEDKLLALLNSIEDMQILSSSFIKHLDYLVGQSEYNIVFDLIYAVSRCRYNSILSNCLYNLKINEFYIKQNSSVIQKSAQVLYEKKDYDSLFMLCKNLKILQHLKIILQKNPEELEKEFLEAQTIDGIRLAFRVVQQELKDDEKAYIKMISKISIMNESEDVKYIYLCYLLKLIQLQKKISSEVKEKLFNIGEIKLLKEKNYGINLLAKCLETILISEGIEGYNEFIEILDVNHIFKHERNIPTIIPYYIYKHESLENTLIRKEYLRKLREGQQWSDKELFRFYMNSFYKYSISIHDFFEAIYGHKEDRVYLKNLYKEYVFYGKIRSIDIEKETATAIFENVAFKYRILLTQKQVGENHISLLRRDDEFSFKLYKFNPGSGYISITNFKLLDHNRQKQFDRVDLSHWETFKCCLKEIISKQRFSYLEKEKLEAIPHIEFKSLKLVNEYVELCSEVLFNLRYKVDEIIEFIKALKNHKNNLFSGVNKDQYISFNRTEEFVSRANETVSCILSQRINEKDLIWIYVNSYLRFTVAVQIILESLLEPGEETLQLDFRFYEYRFYGFLSRMFINEGTKSAYVSTKSIRSLRSMSFLLDKEGGVTEEMIEDKNYVSFRLRKYFKAGNRVVIEDVRNHGQKNKIKLQNWSVIHNSNRLIRYQGRVLKETLQELSELPKLNFIKVEEKRFFPDFIWCMNNLSKNEDDLFLYIKALGINNPYYYIPGEYNKIFKGYSENFNVDQSRIILQQLIDNNYNLSKILWIYLNSYLCGQIPIHNVIEEYYKNNEQHKNRKIHYMPGRIQEILFEGTVFQIRCNVIFLNLKGIYCRCRVCLRLDDTDYTEKDFTEGQEVMFRLSEYNQDEHTIYVEFYEFHAEEL